MGKNRKIDLTEWVRELKSKLPGVEIGATAWEGEQPEIMVILPDHGFDGFIPYQESVDDFIKIIVKQLIKIHELKLEYHKQMTEIEKQIIDNLKEQ